jgi:non-ribosomal peptide synthetase component F
MIRLATMIVGYFAAVSALESTGENPVNTVALLLGVLALLGTVATAFAPVIAKKVRGHTDIRDDTTAQNATLKDAAATAMVLVDKANASAEQAVQMVKGSLEIAKETISDLREQLTIKDGIIADLRALRSDEQNLSAERLAVVNERLTASERERGELAQRIIALEADVAEREARILDLTLSPEKVQEIRDRVKAVEDGTAPKR